MTLVNFAQKNLSIFSIVSSSKSGKISSEVGARIVLLSYVSQEVIFAKFVPTKEIWYLSDCVTSRSCSDVAGPWPISIGPGKCYLDEKSAHFQDRLCQVVASTEFAIKFLHTKVMYLCTEHIFSRQIADFRIIKNLLCCHKMFWNFAPALFTYVLF